MQLAGLAMLYRPLKGCLATAPCDVLNPRHQMSNCGKPDKVVTAAVTASGPCHATHACVQRSSSTSPRKTAAVHVHCEINRDPQE